MTIKCTKVSFYITLINIKGFFSVLVSGFVLVSRDNYTPMKRTFLKEFNLTYKTRLLIKKNIR